MTHARRAGPALAHLGETDPALAVLALWCRHRDGTGPTRTEGETIRYGPGFDLMPLAEQVGMAAHHILHVALRHGPRQAALAERMGPGFDPDLYGIAADAIVNETLGLAGHPLPRPSLRLSELLAAIGAPAVSPVAALAEWDADALALRLHRDAPTRQKARDHGKARAFLRDLAPGDAGDTPQEAEAWVAHLERALAAGRAAGSGIGALAGRLADMAPPRIPWERQLRGLLARALIEAPRVSWRRPSGRWAARHADARARGAAEPAFEPGRQRIDHLPRIVVALDTSSSVDEATLALFSAEIRGIAARMAAETWLLAFDEDVHEERRIDPGDRGALDRIAPRTGGGTDYGPVMARCRALGPSVAVILTDLDALPVPPPACPVLWVTPRPAPPPPYGRALAIAG
ncbi:hypothetical protein E2L08_08515 [Palleronia sediminis]|uniref:Metal-dependent peptidase n=1 Tax=Palleronia sediminis TaxID=2547833 RepID=A0A4R6ABE5_9RHOB|nr:VWA-like domain-containing protein [Palleronia sediminis]TDL79638.1 hypothetical protein E2L08_08515 [Palleronia sediminis]